MERVAAFRRGGQLLEADRLERRTRYDLEMIREIGYCPGIENYSRHLDGRAPGGAAGDPARLLPGRLPPGHRREPRHRPAGRRDVPRRPLPEGDLVEYGFRLPSRARQPAAEVRGVRGAVGQRSTCRRPRARTSSSRRGARSWSRSSGPPGSWTPRWWCGPARGQVDDLLGEIRERAAEEGADARLDAHQADGRGPDRALPRDRRARPATSTPTSRPWSGSEILGDLRLGVFDVLVGINLLREGLDLPEVSLVAILDADKEGFLRSETSLIQTSGRAARNLNGHVVFYADRSPSRCAGPCPRWRAGARSSGSGTSGTG